MYVRPFAIVSQVSETLLTYSVFHFFVSQMRLSSNSLTLFLHLLHYATEFIQWTFLSRILHFFVLKFPFGSFSQFLFLCRQCLSFPFIASVYALTSWSRVNNKCLKILSDNSNIWTNSGLASIYCLFPWELIIFSWFFTCEVTRHWDYYVM